MKDRKLMRVQIAMAVVLGVVTSGLGMTAQAGSPVQTCQQVPVTVPGVTVLGKRVQQVSDVGFCVDAEVGVQAMPAIRQQPECGNPCFSIELERAGIRENVAVEITYSLDNEPQTPVAFRPQALDIPIFDGRMCLVGVGTPDPCIDRITDPSGLWAKAARRRASLGWESSVDTGGAPLTGYDIFRSATGEADSFVLAGTSPEPGFTDRGLRRKSDYWYYVVAFDGDGNRSDPSEIISVRTR